MASGDASRDEYLDLSENMRHYRTIFFAHLTVFMTLTGGLLVFVFKSDPPLTDWMKTTFKIGGLLFSAVFWINHEIHLYRIRHYLQRAIDLEGSLGYRQYSTMIEVEKPKLRPGAWAWSLLYLFIFVFWLVSMLWSSRF